MLYIFIIVTYLYIFNIYTVENIAPPRWLQQLARSHFLILFLSCKNNITLFYRVC